MASVYDYEIGATVGAMTNLEELTTPVNPPRSRFYEHSILNDKADGRRSGHGFPYAVWEFDILTVAMINELRQFCSGVSASAAIKTRVAPDASATTEEFRCYSGVMLWPTQAYMEARRFGGRYMGLEFEFRMLEPETCP